MINNRYFLELFHGPSYSLYDFGLHLTANIQEYFISKRNRENAGNVKSIMHIIIPAQNSFASAVTLAYNDKLSIHCTISYAKHSLSNTEFQLIQSNMLKLNSKNIKFVEFQQVLVN